MRYLPGGPTQQFANESIDSLKLLDFAVVEPDRLPTVFQLWKERETVLSSMLGIKGLKTKGLFDGYVGGNMRVVKSNHVQYKIKSADQRKLRFKADSTGVVWSCAAYPTKPGYKQSIVNVNFDSNWAGYKEEIVLGDRKTHLYILDETPPIENGGVFSHKVKLVASENEEYIDSSLMVEGAEAACVMTMYEHDWSETGVEKYTFDGWGHAYMTLQRLKYSYSGTAEAMGASKVWTEHSGFQSFLTYAENEMMKRAAKYFEYAIVNGKGTVATDGSVLMKDLRGREIMAGDGILNQNEGAYEYPYNRWTLKFLESLMKDADIRADKDGKLELVFMTSRANMINFNHMMIENGFTTMNNNVEGSGAEKGVNNNYSYYEMGNVRIIPKVYYPQDATDMPVIDLPDGSALHEWDGFFVPLGLTDGGDPQVQLVQLRPAKTGSVDGINVGGSMATSIDGTHKHLLFQHGVICRAKIMKIFRPMAKKAVFQG